MLAAAAAALLPGPRHGLARRARITRRFHCVPSFPVLRAASAGQHVAGGRRPSAAAPPPEPTEELLDVFSAGGESDDESDDDAGDGAAARASRDADADAADADAPGLGLDASLDSLGRAECDEADRAESLRAAGEAASPAAVREKFRARRSAGIQKLRARMASLAAAAATSRRVPAPEPDGAGVVSPHPPPRWSPPDEAADSAESVALMRVMPSTRVPSTRAGAGLDVALLAPGEFLVHRAYGVCRFRGVVPADSGVTVPGKAVRDYVLLQFGDGTAKLPASQAARVLFRLQTPGGSGREPKLDRLGDGRPWARRVAAEARAIRALVHNVYGLFFRRLQVEPMGITDSAPESVIPESVIPESVIPESVIPQTVRPPYPPLPPPAAAALSAGFAGKCFVLTPCQAGAIGDIEADLESETPMDRLVLGDVGFGKTEVALRAIARVAASGRQALLLAPTTVLARQHHRLLRERLGPLGLRVEALSRSTPPAARAALLAGLAGGDIDVAVGTHALLGEGVAYKNLGLMVIDEEQRFGVAQKERLKAVARTVDVLTLSATPIPRTLELAVQGFRDMSLLSTPPPSRVAIRTRLAAHTAGAVEAAIAAELARGGQVYYVVPRTATLGRSLAALRAMFPAARMEQAHGALPPRLMDAIMDGFSAGRYDVLVSTTIVESGLDIPNVNTIVVEDAHMFGLASLYQLRGRVGRAGTQAHALLTYPSDDTLSPAARARLEALAEFCSLGDGAALAERDAAIRGVGAIFGEQQAGHVDRSVGSELYVALLLEQLEKVESQALARVSPAAVAVAPELAPAGARIPPAYVRPPGGDGPAGDAAAAEAEAAVAAAFGAGVGALVSLKARLEAAHGPLPEPAAALLQLQTCRWLAGQLGVSAILLLPPSFESVIHGDAASAASGGPPEPTAPAAAAAARRRLEGRLVAVARRPPRIPAAAAAPAAREGGAADAVVRPRSLLLESPGLTPEAYEMLTDGLPESLATCVSFLPGRGMAMTCPATIPADAARGRLLLLLSRMLHAVPAFIKYF